MNDESDTARLDDGTNATATTDADDSAVAMGNLAEKLALCQGDCDSDDDCADGLVCYQRSGGEIVPFCDGPPDNSRTDYCVHAETTTTEEAIDESSPVSGPTLPPAFMPPAIMSQTAFPISSTIPSDLPSLIPSDMPSFTPSSIPSNVDSSIPSDMPSLGPSSRLSLGLPDQVKVGPSNIASSLVPNDKPSLVPSFGPSFGLPDWAKDLAQLEEAEAEAEQLAESENVADATDTSNPVPLALVDHGNPVPSNLLPLGLCEGDCDEDADCAVGLICFQRNETVAVPGCAGDLNSRTDYCIRP